MEFESRCAYKNDAICEKSVDRLRCAQIYNTAFCIENKKMITVEIESNPIKIVNDFRCEKCNNLFKESGLITMLDEKKLCRECWLDIYKCEICGVELTKRDTVTTLENKVICKQCWLKSGNNAIEDIKQGVAL